VVTPANIDTTQICNENQNALNIDDDRSFNDKVADFQRQVIRKSLEDNNQVWAKAALQLKLDRGNLHRQAKRLGLIS
jgi:anaerobic nitric oxide reductase transcription regulator